MSEENKINESAKNTCEKNNCDCLVDGKCPCGENCKCKEEKKSKCCNGKGKKKELLEKIEELQKTISNNEDIVTKSKDDILRAYAEMENIRNRSARDVTNAHKFALEKFAKDLIPVIDSMEKACEIQSENPEALSMKLGIEMTLKMFVESIKKYGLIQTNPINEDFNPNIHEAMTMCPNAELDDNKIMDVFQKGYILNERVVRPARVIVVKNS